LLFNLLELQKRADFEIVGARQVTFLSTFDTAIGRAVAEIASFAITGRGEALAQAKAALEQAHAALVNLQQGVAYQRSTDEGIPWPTIPSLSLQTDSAC
jgi:hypothetical protein